MATEIHESYEHSHWRESRLVTLWYKPHGLRSDVYIALRH